jgi:choline dehydrogenase
MRPESTGTITLRSRGTDAAPIIRPNYLSSMPDLHVLREGVKILREVFSQSAFDNFRGTELSPGKDIRTDSEIERWIRRTADTVFHPVGTCKMGNDPLAVVDQHLRVHGVAGLRVADASIMPTMPSSNTHAPTMMIGEQAARFLREEAESVAIAG